tara:strand:+ start:1072 stop:1527 length:456 start_codon:yes stop_codon:yes gene_type:complete
MAGMIADYGMSHDYTVVKATNDVSTELKMLKNRIASIDRNRINLYLDEIYAIYEACIVIEKNLEHTRKMYGVMPFIQGRYGNLNELIDCTNEYTTHNAFIQLKYPKLDYIDLNGVMVIGKTGEIITDDDEVVTFDLISRKEKKTAIKEVFN